MTAALLVIVVASCDLLACLLQAQAAAAHARLGPDLRVLRAPPLAGVRHRPEVRDAQLGERDGGPAHHPARSAPARADPRHGGAGRGKRSGEKGPAAVPVRPSPLRIQGRADQAQLAEAKQNVDVLKADVDVATQKTTRTKVELDYELYQKSIFDKLAGGAGGARGGRGEMGRPA